MCVQHSDALHMKWELFWPEVSGGGLAWRRKHASRKKKKKGITLLFSKNVQVNLVKCVFPPCRKTFPCFFGLCLPVGWLREIALWRAGGFHCQPLLGWVRAACTWFLCMQKQECIEEPPWHFQLRSTVHHESLTLPLVASTGHCPCFSYSCGLVRRCSSLTSRLATSRETMRGHGTVCFFCRLAKIAPFDQRCIWLGSFLLGTWELCCISALLQTWTTPAAAKGQNWRGPVPLEAALESWHS